MERGPATEGSDEGPEEPGVPLDWLAIGFTLGAIVVGTLAVLAIDPLREVVSDAVRGDTAALRGDIRDLGVAGVTILYALVLVHTVIWYPAEIVDAAAGFVYGFWGGLALVMSGWVLQGIVAWGIGRRAARPVLRRIVGASRFDATARLVENGGVALLLAVRLIPVVPFSLSSYVMGATDVPLGRFTWTTAVGYLPITALFVYLGSRLDSLSPTDPVVLGGAVLLVALILLGRPVSRRLAESRHA